MAYCDYDNGEIGGMISRGNQNTRRKPAPLLLCPPQTPHAARTRTRAAAVGSQRLTAELRPAEALESRKTTKGLPCVECVQACTFARSAVENSNLL
jgi:hypothetical protein